MAFPLTRTGGGDLMVSLNVFGEGDSHHVRVIVLGDQLPPDPAPPEGEAPPPARELLLSLGGNQAPTAAKLALEAALQEAVQTFLQASGV